ncbi:acyl carrier protein [Yinghuangia sp. YIM S10712]|uniref:acyl carrier protein n=1 Tax=Yinghuangia sp. YIM S10712 TaxID=3436930 RepID=UPI003F530B15
MNRTDALDLVRSSARAAVPGADTSALDPERPLRDQLDMDSLDFLSFVENLSDASHVRLDEADYADADTPADFAELVAARSRDS